MFRHVSGALQEGGPAFRGYQGWPVPSSAARRKPGEQDPPGGFTAIVSTAVNGNEKNLCSKVELPIVEPQATRRISAPCKSATMAASSEPGNDVRGPHTIQMCGLIKSRASSSSYGPGPIQTFWSSEQRMLKSNSSPAFRERRSVYKIWYGAFTLYTELQWLIPRIDFGQFHPPHDSLLHTRAWSTKYTQRFPATDIRSNNPKSE